MSTGTVTKLCPVTCLLIFGMKIVSLLSVGVLLKPYRNTSPEAITQRTNSSGKCGSSTGYATMIKAIINFIISFEKTLLYIFSTINNLIIHIFIDDKKKSCYLLSRIFKNVLPGCWDADECVARQIAHHFDGPVYGYVQWMRCKHRF
jgi:hypothetical protein